MQLICGWKVCDLALMFHRHRLSLNTTTDKQPQGRQAIKGLPVVLFWKTAVNNRGKPRDTFVHLIFTTMFSSVCADVDHCGEACADTWLVCMCVQIFLVCLCRSQPRREAESSSSRLPAPPALLQSQWTARAPDYSRLPGRVLVHSLCLCVCHAVYFATTRGCWLFIISEDKDKVSLVRTR